MNPDAGGVTGLTWSAAALPAGLAELARRARLTDAAAVASASLTAAWQDHADQPAPATSDGRDEDRHIDWLASQLALEAEPVATVPRALDTLLRQAGPAVFRMEGPVPRYLLLLGARAGGWARVLAPDLRAHRVPLARLRHALLADRVARHAADLERLLDTAAVPARRRAQVREALVMQHLGDTPAGACWLLRLPPSAPFARQLAHSGVARRIGAMLALFALLYGLEIAGWGLIGNTTLSGRVDTGWLVGWGLLVLSLIPLRLAASWLDARVALDLGALIKARLLQGALRLDLEQVRHAGIGQLLARVMESTALETLAMSGAFALLVAGLELGFAASILAAGAGGGAHAVLLFAWLGVTLALSWRYLGRVRAWTLSRLELTHALVEAMVGHRTRLAQERPERRRRDEDATLARYLDIATRMDAASIPVVGGLARGWMLVALAGLAPAFLQGAGAGALAVSLGGILLADRAQSGISAGVGALARAALAWRQIGALFTGAARVAPQPVLSAATPVMPGSRLIEASGLRYRYPGQDEAVLRGADLTIHAGERLLVEGPSGGGKSTLASLLCGLRQPEAGLLLATGLDRHTLGSAWHDLVTEAPQFHENHILSETLAFNLLMGRHWPPSATELAQARALCEELGLGPLLARMPAGLQQRVGDTGWQLSHGERSRVFLARALLQQAPLTILDETFAALDPETMRTCLQTAFRHAPTLMVVAHP